MVCLMFLAGYALIFALLFATSNGRLDAMGRPLGTDYSQVWVAGQFVLEGKPATPFDPVPHAARQRAEFSETSGFFHWGYPPFFLGLAALFALFPYALSLILWQAASLSLYLFAMRRLLPLPGIMLVAAAYPAVFINFGHGHNGFLTAGLMALGLVLMRKQPWLAGILLGMVAYKPQFGLLIPVALAAGGYWRAFAGAALCVVAMAGASWLAFGTQTWAAFFTSLDYSRGIVAEQGATGWHKIPSLFAWARMWGAGVSIAYGFQIAGTLLAAAVVGWLWWRRVDWRLAGSALLSASLLATPYFLDYDLMVMGPAIALYCAYCLERGFRPWEKSFLFFCWIMPVFARNLAQVTYLPVATLALIGFLALMVQRSLADSKVQAGERSANTKTKASGLTGQLAVFAVAGVLGFLIDVALTIGLTKLFGLSPFVARIPAVAIAILATWVINRIWTFGSNDPDWLKEFLRYGSVSLLSAAINYGVYCAMLLIAVVVGPRMGLGLQADSSALIFVATMAGSAVAAGHTFILSRWFAFRQPVSTR